MEKVELKVLNGKHRKECGKSFVARLRKEGRVPGVMYDRYGKSLPIDVNYNEFLKLFKSVTESTIVQVKLDGDSNEYPVFIKDYQYDIVKNRIDHFDLYEVEAGKPLTALVGIRLDGSPVGVRDGGVLETGIVELDVECLPKDLPPRIIVDVSDLEINETIHVRDLKIPGGVTVLTDEDLVVATVKFVTATIAEDEEADETGTEETLEASDAEAESEEVAESEE
ncbi:MAG: 50S ribosomal protein L25 [Treponemataceae bacterium]